MSGNQEPPKGTRSIALADLRGVRLGRCARRILLLAPQPYDEPSVVAPERADRAAAESHRRAMRRLAGNGLVELTWKTEIIQTRQECRSPKLAWDPDAGVYQRVRSSRTPVERAVERRAVRLTNLGALIVDQIRPALENGRRIRWTSLSDR